MVHVPLKRLIIQGYMTFLDFFAAKHVVDKPKYINQERTVISSGISCVSIDHHRSRLTCLIAAHIRYEFTIIYQWHLEAQH